MSDDRPVLNYASPSSAHGGWKTVWTAANTFEANLAVVALQEHGLHARVDSENVAQNMAPLGGGLVAAKVQVPQEDVAAARTLLAEIDAQRAKRMEASAVLCPSCHARETRRGIPMIRHLGTLMLIATFFVFGVEQPELAMMTVPAMVLLWLWPVTPRWRCAKCGHRFAAPEPEQRDDDDDASD